MVNLSFSVEVFFEKLKLGKVVHVFIQGARSSTLNYKNVI